MSNYPPGVSDRPYAQGVYKYSCADHGTSYGHGYMELGGFFLEDDAIALCDEAIEGDWVEVRAAQCERHGRWTEKDLLNASRHDGYMIETVWECPESSGRHWFITEEV